MGNARQRSMVEDAAAVQWVKTTFASQSSCTNPNPTTEVTQGVFVPESKTTVMDDIVTPNYRKLSGQGHILNNPMTKVVTEIRNNPCSYMYEYSWEQFLNCDDEDPERDTWCAYENTVEHVDAPSSDYLTIGSLPEIPEYDSSSLCSRAVSKAWANVGDTNLQSLVAVAESHKTVASMVSIFTRLIKIIKKIKKLDLKGLRGEISAKELQDRYMELRYAIRPLVYDAKGMVDALTNEAISKPTRMTFRGATTYDDGDSSTDTEHVSYYSPNTGTWTYDIVTESEWRREIFVRSGVLTELQESSQLNIWGLTQPVESAWELIPFSFIIDWFFNIGDVLGSWTPDYGFRNLASWYVMEDVTYQRLSRYYTNVEMPSESPKQEYQAVSYVRTLQNCVYEKVVTTTTRVPNPRRSIFPRLAINLDTLKLTDLLIIAKKIWLKDSMRLRY